jgi:small subunit ribosomal protein S20
MPILKNAKKALRASERKTVYNTQLKSKLKTAVDAVKKSKSAEGLGAAFSKLDKAVKKNIMHRNKAARVKSQLNKLVS